MGGMIAQTLAAQHPEAVRSLVSIMSNTGNRWTGQPAFRIYPYLLRDAPTEREAYVEHTARMFAMIGSTGLPQDPERVRDMLARAMTAVTTRPARVASSERSSPRATAPPSCAGSPRRRS